MARYLALMLEVYWRETRWERGQRGAGHSGVGLGELSKKHCCGLHEQRASLRAPGSGWGPAGLLFW